MNNIGLLVPGRPPSPCDGRAQHYHRPGNPIMQRTRTFNNGTTLTFGPTDPSHIFLPGDGFFEQILVIEKAERDILALRDRYHDVKPEAATASIGPEQGGKQVFASVSSSNSLENPISQQLGHCETSLKYGSSISSTSTLKDELNTQPQEKYLQVPQVLRLSTANVYQSPNRSNSPGLAHPGFSTDTRGHLGFFPFPYPKKATEEADSQNPNKMTRISLYDPAVGRRNRRGRGRPRRGEDLSSIKLCPTPPPGRYPPWMTKDEVHLNECARYARITEELIEVPAKGSRPHMFLRIEPPAPTEIPNVRDVGPRWAYAPLIADNINTRTAQNTIWAEHIEKVTGKKFDPNNSPLGTLYGRPPRHRARAESSDTVFFNENNIIVEPPKNDRGEYVGYRVGGNEHQANQDTDPFITSQPLLGPVNRLIMNTQSRLSSPGLPAPRASALGEETGSDAPPPRSSSAGFSGH